MSEIVISRGIELEIVWHGGKHREYEQPKQVAPRSVMPHLHMSHRQRILFALRDGDWRSTAALREDCRMNNGDLAAALNSLLADDSIEVERRRNLAAWGNYYRSTRESDL